MRKFRVLTEYTYTRVLTVEMPDDTGEAWLDERVRVAAAQHAREEITALGTTHNIKATIDGRPYSVGFIQFRGAAHDEVRLVPEDITKCELEASCADVETHRDATRSKSPQPEVPGDPVGGDDPASGN